LTRLVRALLALALAIGWAALAQARDGAAGAVASAADAVAAGPTTIIAATATAAPAAGVATDAGASAGGATGATPAATEADLYLQAMSAISDGRRDEASATLARMIANGPRRASEWVDLAMIECAIGHGAAAERLFKEIIEKFDPPPRVRELIDEQRALGCARWKPFSQLSMVVGRGHDRNVNQGASNPSYSLGGTGGATLELLPEYLPRPDDYMLLAGDYVRELSEGAASAFAQVLVRRNDRLADYNTASLFAGIERAWQWGRWRLRGTALGGVLQLGGRLYQEQAQLQLRVTPPLALPAGLEAHVQAGLAHVDYKALANFDANTEELRAVLAYRGATTQLQLSGAVFNDHAAGQRPGGDRTGSSLALTGQHRLARNVLAEFDLSRQLWRGTSPYSLPLIAAVRRQDTRVARATLIVAMSDNSALHVEARRVLNRENISIFQYENTVLQLSWHWNGF
jgi:hypothetical protein